MPIPLQPSASSPSTLVPETWIDWMFDIMLISGPNSPFAVKSKEEKEEEEKRRKEAVVRVPACGWLSH